MRNKEDINREVITRLGDHLKAGMPSIRQVIHNFPEANQTLNYPCLSIFSNAPTFVPEHGAYEYQGTQKSAAKYEYLYVVGQYDWTIQIDIWCQSKEQRYQLYDQFFRAFNSQFPVMGLTLTMKEYYEILCRYDMTGLNYEPDGEASSQRKEWRVKIDLLGSCKAVVDREEFAILTTEIDTENINETVEI